MPELTLQMLNGLPQNGPTDPIEYYRKPLVGHLYRERINIGLRLLSDAPVDDVLEIGYGAGAVLLALAPMACNLHGIDLDAEPATVKQTLAARGHEAKLDKGSVYALPYADAAFDLVVSFSVFEHLHDYRLALREVARVLKPHGRFLLGMPAVNRMMEWGFRAIGFKGIEDHHVTTPRSVAREFDGAGFRVQKKRYLGLQRDDLAVYYTWLLSK